MTIEQRDELGPDATLEQRQGAEIRQLRKLLETVAEDLERIAAEERYAAHVDPLRERARRLRAHLHGSRGTPSDPSQLERIERTLAEVKTQVTFLEDLIDQARVEIRREIRGETGPARADDGEEV